MKCLSYKKDFLPRDLQPLLAENGIRRLCSCAGRSIGKGNHFLLELANENDFIKGVVGWIDLLDTKI